MTRREAAVMMALVGPVGAGPEVDRLWPWTSAREAGSLPVLLVGSAVRLAVPGYGSIGPAVRLALGALSGAGVSAARHLTAALLLA